MRTLIAFCVAFAFQIAGAGAQSWEHIKPEGLGFEAEFPGKPELKQTTGEDGGKIWTYVLMYEGGAYDMTVYELQEGAVGPNDVERVLDNMRDLSVHGISGTPRAQAKIEINGHPARELVADVMGMVWRSRLTYANNNIYQIVAIISKANEQSETTRKYLNSLKVLDATAGAAKK